MRTTGAELQLESNAASAELASLIDASASGTPFTLASVDHLGGRRYRCVLGLRREGVAVGYRSLLQLQYRLSGDVELVGAALRQAPAGRLAAVS